MTDLLKLLEQHSKHVVFVSNWYVDETKVSPKQSPFGDGKVSYFTNERRFMFNNITRQLCEDRGFGFVTIGIDKDTWTRSYLWGDGLHPNQAGYQKIFESVQPVVDKYLQAEQHAAN